MRLYISTFFRARTKGFIVGSDGVKNFTGDFIRSLRGAPEDSATCGGVTYRHRDDLSFIYLFFDLSLEVPEPHVRGLITKWGYWWRKGETGTSPAPFELKSTASSKESRRETSGETNLGRKKMKVKMSKGLSRRPLDALLQINQVSKSSGAL